MVASQSRYDPDATREPGSYRAHDTLAFFAVENVCSKGAQRYHLALKEGERPNHVPAD